MQDPIPRLALFPLGLVLLPGERVPLHIFEPRYRRLVREALETDAPFALVLGRDQVVARVATRARVATVLRTHPDGRYDLIVEGLDRCIFDGARLEPDGLLVARARPLVDQPEASTGDGVDLDPRLVAAWRAWSGGDLEAVEELPDPLSWFLARALGERLGAEDRQRLLEMRSEGERRARLAELAQAQAEQRARREAGGEHAKRNGVAPHGAKRPEK